MKVNVGEESFPKWEEIFRVFSLVELQILQSAVTGIYRNFRKLAVQVLFVSISPPASY